MTTTRRGWRSGLEPALLVSLLVVCGGLSVLAHAGPAVSGGVDRWGTPSSHQWTAAESEGGARDSSDDDGDNGEGMDALPVVSATLTADDDDSPLSTRADHDPFLSLVSDGHSFRGPPRPCSFDSVSAPAWTAPPHRDPRHSSDDDDNRDGVGQDDDAHGRASFRHSPRRPAGSGRPSILNHSTFDTSCPFASDGHALRAPPRSLVSGPAIPVRSVFR